MSKNFFIPIKPHLKKWYLKNFDLEEPVKLEEDSLLGSHVVAILQDKRSRTDPKNTLFGRDDITDKLDVILSSTMERRSPRIGKLIRINVFLHHLFQNSLIVWVKSQGNADLNAYTAVKNFLSFYAIDEKEYSLDGAYKLWQRSRSRNIPSKRKKTGENRPKERAHV